MKDPPHRVLCPCGTADAHMVHAGVQPHLMTQAGEFSQPLTVSQFIDVDTQVCGKCTRAYVRCNNSSIVPPQDHRDIDDMIYAKELDDVMSLLWDNYDQWDLEAPTAIRMNFTSQTPCDEVRMSRTPSIVPEGLTVDVASVHKRIEVAARMKTIFQTKKTFGDVDAVIRQLDELVSWATTASDYHKKDVVKFLRAQQACTYEKFMDTSWPDRTAQAASELVTLFDTLEAYCRRLA